MRDNRTAFDRPGVTYHAYVEPRPGAGRGLLAELAGGACLVVADEFPCSFLPRMVDAAARQVDVLLESVDSNGLLPLRAADRVYPTAYAFRRFLQKTLPEHLGELPEPDPLARLAGLPRADVPEPVRERWPAASPELLGGAAPLDGLPIDHSVPPVARSGGSLAGAETLRRFFEEHLDGYAEQRKEIDDTATSGLSPYLHFGHVSIHEVLVTLARREGWTPARLAESTRGKRSGWWGMSPSAEAFLDQAVTWREVGMNFSALREDYDRYESLPDWARTTLREHESDPRGYAYTLDDLEQARTHDELWNAAQRQLRRDGVIHNYLRMLWGKKILKWSPTPRDALERMIELNDKWALDGRDPNSYSGIFWVLGRYDRPWGPERPIFGKVRYMTSSNTARKMRVARYIARWA